MEKIKNHTENNDRSIKKLLLSDVIHMLPTDEEINDQKCVGRSPAHCEEWEGFQQGVKWVIDYIKGNWQISHARTLILTTYLDWLICHTHC